MIKNNSNYLSQYATNIGAYFTDFANEYNTLTKQSNAYSKYVARKMNISNATLGATNSNASSLDSLT